jgi:hypothetical protein
MEPTDFGRAVQSATQVGTPILLRLHHHEDGTPGYVGADDSAKALLLGVFHASSIHPTLLTAARTYAAYRGYTLVIVGTIAPAANARHEQEG